MHFARRIPASQFSRAANLAKRPARKSSRRTSIDDRHAREVGLDSVARRERSLTRDRQPAAASRATHLSPGERARQERAHSHTGRMQPQMSAGSRVLGPFPRETCSVRVERILMTPGQRGGGRGPGVCVPPEHVAAHLRRVEPGRYRISCLDDRRHFVRHGAFVVEVGASGATPRRVPPRSSRDYVRRTRPRRHPSQEVGAEAVATTLRTPPEVTRELARLRREILRRDRRIRPLKELRAELGREHRASLRSLGLHLTQAVAERDRATREADALRVELEAARRELAALRTSGGASSCERGETKSPPVARRTPASSAPSAPSEVRGHRVDLSGCL